MVPHPITRYLYLFVYVPYLATVVHFSPFFLSRTVDINAVLPLWGTENLTRTAYQASSVEVRRGQLILSVVLRA